MKGLMVSIMANVTNMAASANVAAVNAVDANNHSNKGIKIAASSTSPTSPTTTMEASIISPPSTWPAWMQKAMMDNGRVAFRGSNIGIKIGTTLHNKTCSLAEMIKIIEAHQKRLYPDQKPSDFRRKPTPSYLRRHCTCIAAYRAEEGSRIDYDFSVILYDNGWFEYWETGRRTTLYLPDCTEFIYKYNLAIDEIDKTTIDQSVLGNTDWRTVAMLFAEERITQNMVGYGANAPCDNSECESGAGTGAETGAATKVRAGIGTGAETDEGQPISESKRVTEIVGAAHIPTPEERLLKEERRAELSKIIAKATSKLTDKQAEVYKLHFEYEYSLERTGEMIGISSKAAGHRVTGIKERFSEEIEQQTGEDVKAYLNASVSKAANDQNSDNITDGSGDINDNVNEKGNLADTSDKDNCYTNFEDEFDESDESDENIEN